jgi:hypothetical protein
MRMLNGWGFGSLVKIEECCGVPVVSLFAGDPQERSSLARRARKIGGEVARGL